MDLGIKSGLNKDDYYPRLYIGFQALLNPMSQIDFPVDLIISYYLYIIEGMRRPSTCTPPSPARGPSISNRDETVEAQAPTEVEDHSSTTRLYSHLKNKSEEQKIKNK